MAKLRETGIDKHDKIKNETGWHVAKDLRYVPLRARRIMRKRFTAP